LDPLQQTWIFGHFSTFKVFGPFCEDNHFGFVFSRDLKSPDFFRSDFFSKGLPDLEKAKKKLFEAKNGAKYLGEWAYTHKKSVPFMV
jgi:hypothetical protein